MNAALVQNAPETGRRKIMWGGLGLLFTFTVAAVLVGRLTPVTQGAVLTMAGLSAAGTLAMAWLMARGSGAPRWSWWATGGIMATGILLTVFLVADPAEWKRTVNVSTWMLPWFLLVMGTTRARKAPDCGPARARSGRVMLGTGLVLTVILLGTPLIAERLF
jgi:hypothetical protein